MYQFVKFYLPSVRHCHAGNRSTLPCSIWQAQDSTGTTLTSKPVDCRLQSKHDRASEESILRTFNAALCLALARIE